MFRKLSERIDLDVSASDSPASPQENIATASSTSSLPAMKETISVPPPTRPIEVELVGLFSENVAAKIWRVARSHLEQEDSLSQYPEFIPFSGPTAGKYSCKPADFWTCGFFPGSLYALLERSMKYPQYLSLTGCDKTAFHNQLLGLCRAWSEPLHRMAERTNTHDLGFIIQPAFRMDWELTGNLRSLKTVITAANSLASRYDERLDAVRSWDRMINANESITDKENNFLVIIDSMCNLDLLFYAGYHTSNQKLVEIATSHAHFVLRFIVRKDYSTFHLVNIDPKTGEIKAQRTHQGYNDSSAWTRGQAWAILGFTQTYIWTKDRTFLDTAINLSKYFLDRISKSTHSHPYVPVWDFDAPAEDPPLRDTSAGMIAANGLLLLHQILNKNSPYLDAALMIVKETLDLSLSSDTACFSIGGDGKVGAGPSSWDGILMNATANNNENAVVRYSDHGLVYADYYFLEFGNKLMRMGLV